MQSHHRVWFKNLYPLSDHRKIKAKSLIWSKLSCKALSFFRWSHFPLENLPAAALER